MKYNQDINRLSLETIRSVVSALATYRSRILLYDQRVDNKINKLTRSYLSACGITK